MQSANRAEKHDQGSRDWIGVDLEGKLSNRDGYGSRVVVTTTSGQQMRAYEDNFDSYLSASDATFRFGSCPRANGSAAATPQ
jgi:hypothetical protein